MKKPSYMVLSFLILLILSGCFDSSSSHKKNSDPTPIVTDCNGDTNGTASLDDCGICVGGNTGLTACSTDCNGDAGGTAYLDNCSICVGGNTGLTACSTDCNGDAGGTAYLDNCSICVGGNTGLTACSTDCNGDAGGTAYLDNCGVCVDGNTGKIADAQTCHDFTELPLTANGWTDLEELVQSDARIVYVSTSGNDSTGAVYSTFSPEVGSSPYEPSGAILPFATFADAYDELRDGYPDIILLKRGDSWSSFPYTHLPKAGRSKTERFIIGAYGATGNRPALSAAYVIFVFEASNQLITDIKFTETGRSASVSGHNCIEWDGNSSDTMIEGCDFREFNGAAVCQSNDSLGNPVITNVALRRNIVVDIWSGTSHCSGIYTHQITDLLLEENLWDMCGWHPTYQAQNTHSRSMYLSRTPGTIIQGNIDARGSSGGVQLRQGGDYNRNLSLQNPYAVDLGHEQTLTAVTGTVQDNVVLDSRDINASSRGSGIVVGNRALDALITGNIVAHQVSGTGGISAFAISNTDEMTYQDPVECPVPCKVITYNAIFDDNIVYDWSDNGGTDGRCLDIGQSAEGITVTNNTFQQPNGAELIRYLPGNQFSAPEPSWDLSSNTYYSTDSTPFYDGGSGMSYATWVALVSETGSQVQQVSFTDPDRTIETYATLRGLAPTNYEDGLQKFLDEARLQSRWNWREEYTAYTVVNYIRAGFDLDAISADYDNEEGGGTVATTFHAPNTWNNSNNKYKYPEGTPLTAADALQNLAGDGPVMFDGSGNALTFTQAELEALPEMNNNKQLYGCFEVDGTGLAQYSDELETAEDATVRDYFSCL